MEYTEEDVEKTCETLIANFEFLKNNQQVYVDVGKEMAQLIFKNDVNGLNNFSTMPKALETQVGGEHYRKQKIQPIEYIHTNGLDFIQGCVVKYITRFRDKNGKEDLLKIKHYIDLLIELEYPDENGGRYE